MGKDKIKLIVEVDKEILFKGFEQPLTEEERMTLIRAIGNGKSYETEVWKKSNELLEKRLTYLGNSGDAISRSDLKETIIDPLNVNDAGKNDWYEGYYTAKNEDVYYIDNAPAVENKQDELLDYIKLSLKDSDELKEKYRNKYKESNSQHDLYCSHLFEGMAEAYDDLLKKMGESDTQGKQERPKSEWIPREDMDYLDENKVVHKHFQCNHCGFIHDFIDGHTSQYNFCPQCGYRLEGGTE